jgi:type II secretory ATPase GspE/PulE/Tfp pilus assembly ATPase PilB-like protein
MLLDISNPAINIMTVEDPVECILNDVQQTQVNSKAGLTFVAALRSFLRQDPDVIMVGETRDRETAEIALEAAVTGHLVLSTLHTNNAPSAITRMVDMGLEPWLVGTNLIGVIAQRLFRETCQDCREEYTPDNEPLEFLGLKDKLGKVKFYRGAGCEKCKGTGYRGRAGIFEVLTIDRELGKMIASGNDADAILKRAVQKGFVTMAEAAGRKVLEGITTAEEVYRMLSWA